jgi:hypothetical protein
MGAVSKYMNGRDKGVLIIDLDKKQVTNVALRELKKTLPHHYCPIRRASAPEPGRVPEASHIRLLGETGRPG